MSKDPKLKISVARPSFAGPAGSAFTCNNKEMSLRIIQSWYVVSEVYSKKWKVYFVLVHHMREIPGLEDAIVKLPSVTHGISVFRVNHTNPILTQNKPDVVLPQTFYGQWYAVSDMVALLEVCDAIKSICNGELDPNAEEHDDWVMRFGSLGVDPNELNLSYILRKNEIH